MEEKQKKYLQKITKSPKLLESSSLFLLPLKPQNIIRDMKRGKLFKWTHSQFSPDQEHKPKQEQNYNQTWISQISYNEDSYEYNPQKHAQYKKQQEKENLLNSTILMKLKQKQKLNKLSKKKHQSHDFGRQSQSTHLQSLTQQPRNSYKQRSCFIARIHSLKPYKQREYQTKMFSQVFPSTHYKSMHENLTQLKKRNLITSVCLATMRSSNKIVKQKEFSKLDLRRVKKKLQAFERKEQKETKGESIPHFLRRIL